MGVPVPLVAGVAGTRAARAVAFDAVIRDYAVARHMTAAQTAGAVVRFEFVAAAGWSICVVDHSDSVLVGVRVYDSSHRDVLISNDCSTIK